MLFLSLKDVISKWKAVQVQQVEVLTRFLIVEENDPIIVIIEIIVTDIIEIIVTDIIVTDIIEIY